MLEELSSWFWNDRFWLPVGVSFKDLEDRPGYHYAKPKDLYLLPIYALVILCLRTLFEHFVSNPLADMMNVKDRKRTLPEPSSQLEKFYTSSKFPDEHTVEKIAKQMDMSLKQVSNWFRRRRNMDRPQLRKKFAEASWRCFFYLFAFSFGMGTLVQAPWFWDNLACWVDYPRQTMWDSVYYYYMIEGGFYISLLFSIMKDVKRKDFTEQLIHHMATIFLIVFSYVANFVRVGSLVMAIHDVSDIILEGAKCFVYAKKSAVADHMFTLFAIVFIVSRLVVFPYAVIHTTWVKSMWLFRPYAGYYFFNALLMVLQLLHVFWAAIIIRMAVRMLVVGKVEKDARSDVEESSSTEETSHAKQNGTS